MSDPVSIQLQYFNRVFDSWKAAIASVNIRFVCVKVGESWTLLTARVALSAFESGNQKSEDFCTSQLRVGKIEASLSAADLSRLMEAITLGRIEIGDLSVALPDDKGISKYAPVQSGEPNYFVLQLEVRADSQFVFSYPFDLSQTNSELRCGAVPFDGVADLLSFYGFSTNEKLPNDLKILVELQPPADLLIDECSLAQNKMSLTILRRTIFRAEQLSIGLRQFPNPTICRREQISHRIIWSADKDGFERGKLEMELDDCATAELMVSVDGYTVRRWFLLDTHKSLNPRLTDYRFFDANLTQLRRNLIAPKDARQLEVGAAALLHLLGASCLNPPGTESPDVIVETPGKRLALVECTTRVDNVREKTAKLVGRRDGLVVTEQKYGIHRDVMAILLVNQPLTSLVNERPFLLEHNIVLLTLEDINAAIDNLEMPPELDRLYIEKQEAMRSTR